MEQCGLSDLLKVKTSASDETRTHILTNILRDLPLPHRIHSFQIAKRKTHTDYETNIHLFSLDKHLFMVQLSGKYYILASYSVNCTCQEQERENRLSYSTTWMGTNFCTIGIKYPT